MKSKAVIATIITLIIVLFTATAFTAVAEEGDEYDFIPSYTIEMGTILSVNSTLNTYNQIVVGTIDIENDTIKVFRISKNNNGYILDGVNYPSNGESEIERIMRGYTIVSISGYYRDVYYFKEQLNIEGNPNLYMFNTLVTSHPISNTTIAGSAYAVNQTQISKFSNYNLLTTQKYLPTVAWVKVVTDVTRYGQYLQADKTIYYYKADTKAYNQGYNEGYAKANNTVNRDSASYIQGLQDSNAYDYTFYGLMSSVINAPVEAFSGMFDINILGTNLRSFLLALLTIAIVIMIIRKFVA